MEYFLKKARRKKLIDDLMAAGCERDQAERVIGFLYGEHDRHMFAHAMACIKGANDGDRQGMAFIYLSSICLAAIEEESKERGLTAKDFPTATPLMEGFIAAEEATRQAKKPN